MSSKDNGGDAPAGQGASTGGPKKPITDSLAKPLPKRFYKDVSLAQEAAGGWRVLLDGRSIKTPGKRQLELPTRGAAELVAHEWRAQGASIDPATMPATRFANTAIDAVAAAQGEVAADIVAYAGRDLLCYRAQAPNDLVLAQAQAWDPVLAWAREALGAPFTVTQGIMPIDQPATALDAVARAITPHDPFRLTALHVMTTLTGSAISALAHERGAIDWEQAWAAAHVDEDYQASLWGEDYEAVEKRKRRRSEFEAASNFAQALKASDA